ncbi:MAG: Rne/Rng family ribonuclease, partial [Phycisphaerae bacterium]
MAPLCAAEGGVHTAAPAEAHDGDNTGEPKKRRRGRRGGVRHRKRREAKLARESAVATATAGAAPDERAAETVVRTPKESGAKPVATRRGGARRTTRSASSRTAKSVRRTPTRDPEESIDRRADEASQAPEPSRKRAAQGDNETQAIETSKDPRADRAADKYEMLINVADPDECRIALVLNGRMEELYMERTAAVSRVGNIYKGRITNVEPSIQAAFVDIGLPVHGFLHITDLHPEYFPGRNEDEAVGRKTPRRDRPLIQKCLRRGQEVTVQIIKEGIGTKGPTLTTYISLPGRYLVMMPGMSQLGVSRKIEDDETRRKARQALNQLKLPKDMGLIVRTAGVDRTRRELQHDMNYLGRLWDVVQRRIRTQGAPSELYQESDLVIRTVRDAYTSDIARIVVDDEAVSRRIKEFLAIANPRTPDRVVWYTGTDPLFHLYGIEADIEELHARHVPLPCGGSLVIDPTEALVAIDVNSGKFRIQNDAEESARRVNLEAAQEIARQLRLRDLGGLIICDFIDMRLERHQREVERCIREALKGHKERARVLRMSQFGIIEITRQRQGPSISRSVYHDCPNCLGRGLVKTDASVTLDVIRVVHMAAHRDTVSHVRVHVSPSVAEFLLNRKRSVLERLEAETGKTITITAAADFGPDRVSYTFTDLRGREIPLASISPVRPAAPPGRRSRAARSAAPARGRTGRTGRTRETRAMPAAAAQTTRSLEPVRAAARATPAPAVTPALVDAEHDAPSTVPAAAGFAEGLDLDVALDAAARSSAEQSGPMDRADVETTDAAAESSLVAGRAPKPASA